MSCPRTNPKEVDRLIHEPVRFEIMTILYSAADADFMYVQRRLQVNQGKISSDLTRLQEAGYIEIKKTFDGKIPITLCNLTAGGRTAYEKYIAQLKQKLADTPDFGAAGQLRSRGISSNLPRRRRTRRAKETKIMPPQGVEVPRSLIDENEQ